MMWGKVSGGGLDLANSDPLMRWVGVLGFLHEVKGEIDHCFTNCVP